jgi:hypothetical protein
MITLPLVILLPYTIIADPEYTKVFSTNQHGAKSAKYTCNNCNEENVVYWTKI